MIKHLKISIDTETYSGLCQISKLELFANIRNDLKLLAIALNSSISDVWLSSKYASEVCLSRAIFTK